MADPNLEESAWQRAKTDAAGIYPSTAFQVAAALATIIFGAVAAVAASGQDTTTQIAILILGGALALALAFLFVFGFELAAAPVRQRNELRSAWDKDSGDDRPRNIAVTLRNERRKAAGFFTMREGRFVTTTQKREEAEVWTNQVVELLTDNVDDEAATEFIEAPKGNPNLKVALDAQTDALDRIIERIDPA